MSPTVQRHEHEWREFTHDRKRDMHFKTEWAASMKDEEELEAEGGTVNARYVSIWLSLYAALLLLFRRNLQCWSIVQKSNKVDGQRSFVDVSFHQVPRFARQVDFGFCTILVVRGNNILVNVGTLGVGMKGEDNSSFLFFPRTPQSLR